MSREGKACIEREAELDRVGAAEEAEAHTEREQARVAAGLAIEGVYCCVLLSSPRHSQKLPKMCAIKTAVMKKIGALDGGISSRCRTRSCATMTSSVTCRTTQLETGRPPPHPPRESACVRGRVIGIV